MGGGAKKDVWFVGGTVGEIGVMEVDGSTKSVCAGVKQDKGVLDLQERQERRR